MGANGGDSAAATSTHQERVGAAMVGPTSETTLVRAPDAGEVEVLREQLAALDGQVATLRMFARVLEAAPVVVWALDRNACFTMVEGKGLETHGTRSGEWVGLNALEVFGERPELAGAIVRALGGDETRVVAPVSAGAHFEYWFMPLRHKGDLYGVMGLAIDATERVRSETELREKLALIERQSATIRALATPIIKVWDDVLCLPIVGTVDSMRTSDMMQGLLEAVVREQASYAIIDLTGVEVVDTSTADHLVKLFRAAKVLGVDGILSGIRPAVAQTVIALGLELEGVRTVRTLRDALRWCIAMRGDHLAAAQRLRAGFAPHRGGGSA
jgi:rsbT co-antagonist protein RsbR